jgi:hypothetical protein
MTGSDTLVCVRCGFDLKTLKVLETSAGEQEEPEEEPQEQWVVSPPGRGGDWVPVGLAAGSALVLAVGYLAGAGGLFAASAEVATESGEVSIGLGARLLELLRCGVLVGILIGCGMLALLGLALLWNGVLGDARLALLRVAAIVLTMRLVTFIGFARRSAEWTVETLVQAAILVGLAMLLLRLQARDAVLFGLLMLASLGAFWAVGQLVTWVL